MKTNEIVHVNGRLPKPDCDWIDSTHVLIRIKTGKDIKRVEVVYNDPYIRVTKDGKLYWPYHTIEMEQTGETYTNYYFSATIPCDSHRLKYCFQIYDEYECLQYSESGFTKNYNHDDLAMFFVPYIVESSIFDPPEWVENVIWYQMMPIRFNENISGIREKLSYLKDLGINGLYINPIFHACSYHKYDVIDYTKVDPELGTEEDFVKLCKAAHDLGMKVMLDISVTHCSDKSPMFQDVIKKKRKSKYYDMFKVSVNEDDELGYECFGMITSMPKFETDSPKAIEYFTKKVLKKWMDLGVDAWRLDVANEISDTMLEEIRETVEKHDEDIYIVGEIWHNAAEWLSSEGLDGVTNYAVSRAILRFVCENSHDIYTYRSAIDKIIHSYTMKQLKASMPLLDSHDTPRLRTVCNHDKDKVKIALLLLLTFYGTPSLYYGTERYMEGGNDPDNRRPTNWEEESEDLTDIYRMCQMFIRLRKEHPALANEGELDWVDHNELLIMQRKTETENIYVVINSKEYDIDTVLPMDGRYINLIDGSVIGKQIHMGRLGFMVLLEK